MRTPSIKALKYWLEVYTKVDEIPELADSYVRSCTIAQEGTATDSAEVADLLMNFPFTGFFYGFVDDSNTEVYKVSVIHHAFKLEAPGVEFNLTTHMVYGIEGLSSPTNIVEIPMDIFEYTGERKSGFLTPDLNDFIIAAVGTTAENTRDLVAVKSLKASEKEFASGKDSKGHPLPIAHPRRYGIIPPLLMPAFCDPLPENILPVCLTLIAGFAAEFLNAEAKLELWTACFPTLQLLWILGSMPPVPSNTRLKMFTVEKFPELTDNEWAIRKGKSIESLYIDQDPPASSSSTTATGVATNKTTNISQSQDSTNATTSSQAGGRKKAGDYFKEPQVDEEDDSEYDDGDDDDDSDKVVHLATIPAETQQQPKKKKRSSNKTSSDHRDAAFERDFMREMLMTTRDNQAALVDILKDGYGGNGESSGSSAKWTKRFHEKHQLFICFICAQDPSVAPLEPPPEFKQLLESNQKQVTQLIQFNINQQRNGSQTVDNPLALIIYNVSFIKNANSEGLSIFYACPAPNLVLGGPTASSMSPAEVELRKETNMLTAADIKKLTASQIQIPKDEHAFTATLENHMIVVDYLMSQDSLYYKSLEKLKVAIADNKAAFASMVASDKGYLVSLMAAIDVKAQLFFNSCAKASSIDKINFSILDLQSEIESFWFKRSINVQLPFQVAQIVAAANKEPAADIDGNKKIAAAGKRQAQVSRKTQIQEKEELRRSLPSGELETGRPILDQGGGSGQHLPQEREVGPNFQRPRHVCEVPCPRLLPPRHLLHPLLNAHRRN